MFFDDSCGTERWRHCRKKYITCIVGIYNKFSISKNVYRTEDGDSQT